MSSGLSTSSASTRWSAWLNDTRSSPEHGDAGENTVERFLDGDHAPSF